MKEVTLIEALKAVKTGRKVQVEINDDWVYTVEEEEGILYAINEDIPSIEPLSLYDMLDGTFYTTTDEEYKDFLMKMINLKHEEIDRMHESIGESRLEIIKLKKQIAELNLKEGE